MNWIPVSRFRFSSLAYLEACRVVSVSEILALYWSTKLLAYTDNSALHPLHSYPNIVTSSSEIIQIRVGDSAVATSILYIQSMVDIKVINNSSSYIALKICPSAVKA